MLITYDGIFRLPCGFGTVLLGVAFLHNTREPPPSPSDLDTTKFLARIDIYKKRWSELFKYFHIDAIGYQGIHQLSRRELVSQNYEGCNGKEASEVLQEEFQGNSKVRSIKVQTLRRDFENLMMNESESLKDYYSKLNEIVNQMALYGEVVTDKKVVEKILISLTDKYDAMVSIIEETKDINTLKSGELMASLQSHEQRLMRHSEKSIESVLQCKLNLNKKESPSHSYNGGVSSRGGMFNRRRVRGQRGRGKSNYNRCLGNASETNKCEICKRSSHTEKDCWFIGKPQCHHCKKFGHLQKDCRFKNQQQVNVSEEKKDGYAVFYSNYQVTNEKSSTTWLLDSGCSNHMTGDITIFTKIDKSITAEVKMGNGILVQARGKGTICIQTKDGIRYINDVLLIPDLDQNLLSVGQLIENGYATYFEDDTCTIYDKNKGRKLVAKIQMKRGRSFQLMFNYDADLALKAHLKDESLLWHKRLEHIHSQGLKELKNMVYGLPQVEDNNEVCEGCAMGKHHRNSFPKGGSWRAGGLLELVHTDVCGPMRTPSLAENRYFVLFIDDYSRMTWVYFMKYKSEVFSIFKKFKKFVEKQSGCYIKVLRSDRGKEYTSREFSKFCEDEGIDRQLTVGYSPQQNGVSERKNQTVVNMAKSMLKEKGFPNSFWAEAIHTAVYLINRCPTKAVKEMTPLEAWCRKKPSVSQLKIFGCICYAHIPKEKRHKLEDTSEKCILLGYSSKSKGYRLYSLKNKSIIISKDVLFDEGASWNWEKEACQNQTITFEAEALNEDKNNDQSSPASSPSDPTSPTNPSSPSSDSARSSSSGSTPLKMWSLADIYESCNFCMTEPTSFEDAIREDVWKKAMEQEFHMIEKNKTWQLVERPKNKEVVGVKSLQGKRLNSTGKNRSNLA
ncbi:hypothetical protein AgCh_015569 [Apium graveolens]